WPSLVLAIASAFVGALGVISVKRLTEFKPLEMQAWFTWISLPLLAALTAVASPIGLDGLQALSPTTWGAVAYTAIAGSLIGHTAFYYLVQRYPVTSVAPLTMLSPVFSVVFGVTLLHDVLTPRLLAGGVLTLTGVLIIQTRERRLTDTGS
ncbi:MAG: DMT family transporter, partial [Steroidobacteraceae bacterium]